MTFEEFAGPNRAFLAVPSEIISPPELFASPTHAPAIIVQLTSFTGSPGSIISLSLHHRVGDGSAQFAFFKAWAAEARGEPVSVARVHERAALPKGPIPAEPPLYYEFVKKQSSVKNTANEIEKTPEEPKAEVPSPAQTEDDPLLKPVFVGPPVCVFRFSCPALAARKASLASQIRAPQYVSSNDVLLATLMKAIARANKWDEKKSMAMKVSEGSLLLSILIFEF